MPQVGLPWDPELYDHMLTHGVFIEDVQVRRLSACM